MKNLNLIPPSYKDHLRLQRVYALFKRMFVAIILYTIFLAIALLSARFVLDRNFTRIVGETTLVTTENRETERRIAALNEQISSVQTMQRSAVPWTEFLISFPHLIPTDITINSLKADAQANTRSTITGRAETRQALLDFKERLSAAPYIKEVYLPLQDLYSKTDINFTITLTLELDKVPPL